MSHEYYVISTHLCIRHSRYNPHPHTACENQTRSACAWTNSKSLFRVMHKPNAMQTACTDWILFRQLRFFFRLEAGRLGLGRPRRARGRN